MPRLVPAKAYPLLRPNQVSVFAIVGLLIPTASCSWLRPEAPRHRGIAAQASRVPASVRGARSLPSASEGGASRRGRRSERKGPGGRSPPQVPSERSRRVGWPSWTPFEPLPRSRREESTISTAHRSPFLVRIDNEADAIVRAQELMRRNPGDRSESDEAVPDGDADGVGAVDRSKLPADRRDVGLDGLVADVEARGDRLVRQPQREKLQHFELTP